MSESDYKPKLVHLPGTKLSPEVVLRRTLNKQTHIKGVVIGILWDDDSIDFDWSQIPVSMMCMLALGLQKTAQDLMYGKLPEALCERDSDDE